MRRAGFATAFAVLVALTLDAAARRVPLGLDLYRPAPLDNPLTPEKVALGRRLFHERRLSHDGSLSCAACHDPRRAFTNGRHAARRDRPLPVRDVPTLVNRAWGASYFWDGRAASLEEQALGPILNGSELGSTPDAVARLARSAGYRRHFLRIFDREPTIADVAAALASYVRTIVAGDSPFDRFAAGDGRALSQRATRGLILFRTKARCVACHAGPLLSDEQFHNTGVAWRLGTLADEGRYRVTRSPADRGAFKTPTLREIARTAPYMHDGSLRCLEEVLEFYNAGGRSNPWLDREIHPLDLSSSEKEDLVAFLRSLSGEIQDGS